MGVKRVIGLVKNLETPLSNSLLTLCIFSYILITTLLMCVRYHYMLRYSGTLVTPKYDRPRPHTCVMKGKMARTNIESTG